MSQATADQEQASLEEILKGEILSMYQEVADHPDGDFHFFHGQEAAELFEYDDEAIAAAPVGAVQSFAGVGNPHPRANLCRGETVVDLGSGAGLDAILAARAVGESGAVIGVDLNPVMCRKAEANAAEAGVVFEAREGRMEALPVADESVDVVISNGVLNLSFQKRKVIEEMYRVLKPGGRISFADIVSAKQLSQSIVNDPKLWAS